MDVDFYKANRTSIHSYVRLAEIEENYLLLLEATRRIAANENKSAIPDADVMEYFGITEADLEEIEESEIE